MRCYAYDHPYFVGFLQNVGVSYKMPEFALGMTTSYLNGPHYNLKKKHLIGTVDGQIKLEQK
jgi:hypothetical protein